MQIDTNVAVFFNFLEEHHPQQRPLSADLKDALCSITSERKYHKGQHLLLEEQMQSHIWFIITGSARLYQYNSETSNMITTWFWQKHNLVFSFKNFFRGRKLGSLSNCSKKAFFYPSPLKTWIISFLIFRNSELLNNPFLGGIINSFSTTFTNFRRSGTMNGISGSTRSIPRLIDIAAKQHVASFLKMHRTDLSRIHNFYKGLRKQ